MTIGIIGGEGSVGKTTILNLLAQHTSQAGLPTLYVDANPDQNGLEFGGVPDEARRALPVISTAMDFLRATLEGRNPLYKDNLDQVITSSPVTKDSGFWRVSADDAVMRKFSLEHHGLSYMQTGSFTVEDAGVSCSHEKTSPLGFMLERLDDGLTGQEAKVLIDYAHGEDGFSTPLYPQSDLVIVAARPNKKSADIMSNYLRLSEEISEKIGHEIEIAAIGNMLSTDSETRTAQEDFLRARAKGCYVGGLTMDPTLEAGFETTVAILGDLSDENQRAIASLAERLDAADRDLDRREAWRRYVHGNFAAYYDDLMDTGGAIAAQEEHAGHRCGSGCDHHHHHPDPTK